MFIEINADDIAEKVAIGILIKVSRKLNEFIYPVEIKGDELAGRMIGLTGNAMKQRRYNGFYIEGKHFYKKSDKIIMWFRDALLDEEALNGRSKTVLSA